jgi:glycosyltransferase involved in cell wall biosynthesis
LSGRSPRILFIASSFPLGGRFGGQIRALHIGRALKHVGPVRVVVVNTEPGSLSMLRATEAEFEVLPPVRCLPKPNTGWMLKAQWALNPRFMNVHGVAASDADRARVSTYCAESDLVWVLNARTPNLLQQWAWPRAHLDLDDVHSTYLRTLSNRAGSMRERAKAALVQSVQYRRERSFVGRFSTLSVCSREDREYLGGGDRIHVIPNGFDRPANEPSRRPLGENPRLGFIGLGSFEPNVDGVTWFLQDAWPKIKSAVPGVRFRLVGKSFDSLKSLSAVDVDILGELPDAASEIATWAGMVVPIRLGSGTRIKIAEAFSRKCPVVSTSLGAYGYDVQDREHLRIADTPAAFADACIDVVLNPAESAKLADRAFDKYLQNWTWDAIAPKVWAAAEACLRGAR